MYAPKSKYALNSQVRLKIHAGGFLTNHSNTPLVFQFSVVESKSLKDIACRLNIEV